MEDAINQIKDAILRNANSEGIFASAQYTLGYIQAIVDGELMIRDLRSKNEKYCDGG